MTTPRSDRYVAFLFPNLFIEERLGVSSTCRNWNTVSRVAELARVKPDV